MKLVVSFGPVTTSVDRPSATLDPRPDSRVYPRGQVFIEVGMNIGQLARQAGVPVDTVRYYERQQLLPTARRSAGGYRVFGDTDLTRLQFIRRAKALGFTLDEIAALLSLSDQRGPDMARVRDTAVEKLTDIERRITELQSMHGALKTLVDACPGHGELVHCPILSALTGSRQ